MERTLISETIKNRGKIVFLKGWVTKVRDHGKITFVDLRDRSGIVQVVGNEKLKKLHPEDIIQIRGVVKNRPENLVNPNMKTGIVEVEVRKIKVLSKAKEPPFPIDGDGYEIGEEVRLKYRYLDLRRPRLQHNLKVRSRYVQAARKYLFSQDFVEIETPLLTKSTPEGARDFIVPSRLNPGKFFALPQSPQQYKQLLMAAGFERYFQIARCLRDEDLRADRGFEHTQIDIEASFVTRDQVMKLVEEMTVYALEKIGAKIAKKPFPVITYEEAMKAYGADRFDLRTDVEKKKRLLSFAWVIDFPFFEKDSKGGWTFTHNPFSQPVSDEHERWLLKKKNIAKIITSQYDLVCNGLEVSGGSIRSNKPEVLKAVFEILGYSKKAITEKFGHMIEAFEYGAPPHGGCAQGFERLLMAFLGEEYLREVQAFPQTGRGRTSVMDAPSRIGSKQLQELHIRVTEAKKRKGK
jgi:aspartyl-tRNA synthetase